MLKKNINNRDIYINAQCSYRLMKITKTYIIETRSMLCELILLILKFKPLGCSKKNSDPEESQIFLNYVPA